MSDSTPPWRYKERLNIITHDADSCPECASWVNHYMHAMLNDDVTLREAEEDRNHILENPLVSENQSLRENNDALIVEITTLRVNIENNKSTFLAMKSERDDLYTNLQYSRDKAKALHQQITNEQYSPHRKIARLYSRSPSFSASRGTYTSLSKRSSSPTDKDTPMTNGPLISRITNVPNFTPDLPSDLPIQISPAPSIAAPTPFLEVVGFPSMIPVLIYGKDKSLIPVDGTTQLTADGKIEFDAHPHYVLAMGCIDANGYPQWCTSLVRRQHFLTLQAIAACAANTPLPLTGIVMGGRNGVLISPAIDPKNTEEIDNLLSDRSKQGKAAGYIDRVRFTPPELRNEEHSAALT